MEIIKVNTIITLDNLEQYVVLSEATYEGLKYFLMMGIDENKELISSKVSIMQEEIEDNITYVSKITDPLKMSILTKLLKEQI